MLPRIIENFLSVKPRNSWDFNKAHRMCERLILDTNVSNIVLDDKVGKKRDPYLTAWIGQGHGTLCYTVYGKLGDETRKTKSFMKKLETWQSRGRAIRASLDKIDEARNAIEGFNLRSNDSQTLALAIAYKAKILCTNDNDLKHDFKDVVPKVIGEQTKLYPVKGTDAERETFLTENRCRRVANLNPAKKHHR